jgi:hypothetical protein
MGRLTLGDALELTALVARKEPHRYGRYAVWWLARYIEERAGAAIDELALVANCLAALLGTHHQQALRSLHRMTQSRQGCCGAQSVAIKPPCGSIAIYGSDTAA